MGTIHIALTFDDAYTQQSVVLMTSILHNKNEDEKIHFHILDGGLSSQCKSKIFEIKNCEITFHLVNNKLFKNYKKKDYYPVSMLWSIILPDVIQLDKLIYLDGDIIVNTSLRPLWELDLGDNYIAAVEDANGQKYSKKFRINPWSRFFNSGVMVINCGKWRENNISKYAVEMAMQNAGSAMGLDQNILNKLFKGKVKFLDLKWNLQYCPFSIWPSYKNEQQYKQAIENPAVIHYVGDFKPWKKGLGCFNPKQQDYLKYHQMTSFAFKDLSKWMLFDKLMAPRGIFKFIKRYPLFFVNKNFWKNLI